MKAISLWQPWASAIARGPKRVENRAWAPRGIARGDRFAVHAAKTLEEAAIGEVRRRWPDAPEEYPAGRVVCVATLLGLADCAGDAEVVLGEGAGAWFSGPVGWLLGDVVALPDSAVYSCRGMPGVFALHAVTEDAVLRYLRETSAERVAGGAR